MRVNSTEFLVLHLLCMLQIFDNELLKIEVSLEGEVVLQVGGGKCISIEYEGLAGHQLHEVFAEVPHKPLLEQGHH